MDRTLPLCPSISRIGDMAVGFVVDRNYKKGDTLEIQLSVDQLSASAQAASNRR